MKFYTMQSIIGKLRATKNFLIFVFLLLFFVARLLVAGMIKGFEQDLGVKHRQQFARTLLPLIGIKVIKEGATDHKNVLYVSNHRSYLDPFIQVVDIDTLALAKAEVESWPVLGYGIKITGTYFVKREDKNSRKLAREGIADTIKNGRSILLYPEGTTSDLPKTLPFKPRTFQMAAQNGVKIVPIAIEYKEPSDAWIGDDTFLRHFFQVFARKKILCEVHYGNPIWQKDGDELKSTVQQWIDQELTQIRRKWSLPVS